MERERERFVLKLVKKKEVAKNGRKCQGTRETQLQKHAKLVL